MYNQIIYTGQVTGKSRIKAILGALTVLWAALNGWIVSGLKNPQNDGDRERRPGEDPCTTKLKAQ